MAFAGTMRLSPATFLQVLRDLVGHRGNNPACPCSRRSTSAPA
ncbi:hypothetical protein [Kribbella aluminosa]